MHSWLAADRVICVRRMLALVVVLAVLAFILPVAHAQQAQAHAPTSQAATQVQDHAAPAPAHEAGGEANLKLPDMGSVSFLGGTSGYKLLSIGLIFCALGLLFGL